MTYDEIKEDEEVVEIVEETCAKGYQALSFLY